MEWWHDIYEICVQPNDRSSSQPIRILGQRKGGYTLGSNIAVAGKWGPKNESCRIPIENGGCHSSQLCYTKLASELRVMIGRLWMHKMVQMS